VGREGTTTTIASDTLNVSGSTALTNASCTSFGINKTSITSTGTNPVYAIQPQQGSNQGALELGSKYGLYNLPYGLGTNTVTDGGLTLRATNTDGTSGSVALRVRGGIPADTTADAVSGTNTFQNLATSGVFGHGLTGTTTKTYTSNSADATNSYGRLSTGTDLISGIIYKVCFRVNSPNPNTSINFDVGGGNITQKQINVTVNATPTTVNTVYFRTNTSGMLYLNLYRSSPSGINISYDFFSIQSVADTTINSLSLNTPMVIGYTPTFTSNQIGFSGSTYTTGSIVNGVNNVFEISNSTLPGVYMITTKAIINTSASPGFSGVNGFRLETGYYAGEVTAQNYIGSASFIFIDYRQTITTVYNGKGGQNFYAALQLGYQSVTGTPVYSINVYYTRIA
jgi:hypothetical protein